MRKRVGSPKRSHHRPEQPADVIIAEKGKILAIGKHLIARPLTERRDGQVKIGVIRNLGARQFSDVALQGPIIGKNEYPNRTAESQPVSPTEPESALLLQTKQSRRGLAAARCTTKDQGARLVVAEDRQLLRSWRHRGQNSHLCFQRSGPGLRAHMRSRLLLIPRAARSRPWILITSALIAMDGATPGVLKRLA
jgi:hypothetical protein